VIRALGERYSATAPDIRGHGSASGIRPVTLDDVLEDLRQVQHARFTLAGYSMGGRIAVHAALAMPARIERLVLVGASPGIEDPAERAGRATDDERLAGEIESSTIDEFAERWAASPVLSGQAESVARAARVDRLRSDPQGLAAALRGLGTASLPSAWERLGEIERPVALVVGERDRKFKGIGMEMAARLGRAELHVVPGAGHAVHLEAPRAVAEIIAS
jgi:2-succinyl-6-hydroxy-2,4-cyclohexadiene-1-carboxylate synthase